MNTYKCARAQTHTYTYAHILEKSMCANGSELMNARVSEWDKEPNERFVDAYSGQARRKQPPSMLKAYVAAAKRAQHDSLPASPPLPAAVITDSFCTLLDSLAAFWIQSTTIITGGCISSAATETELTKTSIRSSRSRFSPIDQKYERFSNNNNNSFTNCEQWVSECTRNITKPNSNLLCPVTCGLPLNANYYWL